MLHLQEGATLQSGKYKIEKVLGQGGFGITYLAVQYPLKKKVAIKEKSLFIKFPCQINSFHGRIQENKQFDI